MTAPAPARRRILGVQNVQGEGLGRFERILRAQGHDVQVVHAYRGDALPPVGDADAVLVGGTPLAAYHWEEHPFLREEAAFLLGTVAAGTPCLGICFGAQFLAHLLGGRAFRADRMEIGRYAAYLTEDGRRDPVLAGFPPSFRVFHWHGDTFDLPPGAAHLVRGDGCRHQMFRRENVVGVQFHLEVDAADASAWTTAYAAELSAVGKTRTQVVAEAREIDAEAERLSRRLMDNFLTLRR